MQKLRRQTQPNSLSCIATCLAMLTHRPASFIDQEFTQKYTDQKTDIPMFLSFYGIMCKPGLAAGIHNLHQGKLYLATVPSLMTSGLFHQVIIDTRFGIIDVYDPAEGFSKTSQYYIRPDSPKLDHDDPTYDKLAFPLRTWILDYELMMVKDGR